jgi:PIN domain nuclease of toxin-antitoxin system
MICLDTHVIVWLYQGEMGAFRPKALKLIEEEVLAISPAVSLELQFLREIGRLTIPSHEIVEDLKSRIGLSVLSDSFEMVAGSAARLSWTRDPMDRLIVGHAQAFGYTLITKDRMIRKHYTKALW